jgi:signal transduction histidine kinase
MINANPSQMNQVFVNLIANAAQAIEQNGKIIITTSKDQSHFHISIKDNGSGISKENIAKIFDPFFTTKKIGDGTGLGLAIVYGIIQRHGGHIDVKSVTTPDPNHGTEFKISLPIKGPSAEGNNKELSKAS